MCLWTDIHRFIVRMPWLLHYLCLLLPLAMSMVSVVDSGKRLPSIYWNSSNPMFLISNNDHVIEANIDDHIDIVCPYYDEGTPEYLQEYYTVYMVTRSEYSDCRIYNRSEARLIVNCSQPTTERLFTITVKSFWGVPNMPDFESGKNYYFISTSTGRKQGLSNQVEGACSHEGMKMMLRVCCSTSRATQSQPVNRGTTVTPRRPLSHRTTLRTTRRTTPAPPPTTTTPVIRPRPAITTLKPKRPDYETKDNNIDNRNGPGEKMPPITDMKESNSALINSTASCSQISVVLLTIVQILFILCR